jgi:hypothetical protein
VTARGQPEPTSNLSPQALGGTTADGQPAGPDRDQFCERAIAIGAVEIAVIADYRTVG